jgi:hypothetical protein
LHLIRSLALGAALERFQRLASGLRRLQRIAGGASLGCRELRGELAGALAEHEDVRERVATCDGSRH